jgi:hypothetical protein
MREMILWPWDGWGEAGLTPSSIPPSRKRRKPKPSGQRGGRAVHKGNEVGACWEHVPPVWWPPAAPTSLMRQAPTPVKG